MESIKTIAGGNLWPVFRKLGEFSESIGWPRKERSSFISRLGCYGCREATDIGPDESIFAFPFSDFENITEYIEFLAEKAIPLSREKNALVALKKKMAEEISKKEAL